MVDKIYEIKNQLLERIMRDISERGIERLDSSMVDMVKDLAEAEKSCWEAEYYRSVSEAMEGESGSSGFMGYNGSGGGGGGSRGGSSGGSGGGRSGWQNQYGSGRNRGGRRGYDGMSYYHDPMESVRAYMRGANPQEQERVRAEMRSMMDGSM